jgi:hypothetical protein
MGQEALYKCKSCGKKFVSREGGGVCFDMFRCVRCDWIKEVNNGKKTWGDKRNELTVEEIGKCRRCGGDLRDDLAPMCRDCGSRDVELKEPRILYD